MKNAKTWETQYHLIMALSDCAYKDGLTFLKELALNPSNESMVNIAIGDAITSLEYIKYDYVEQLRGWLIQKKDEHLEGAIRAIAMKHIIPYREIIVAIIEYVNEAANEGLTFWLASASPGWPEDLTKTSLNNCLENDVTSETKKAAEAALMKKYLKWKPL